MRWSALPLVLLTSAACGAGQRFVLEEPRSDTFVRVVVAFSGTTKEVTVLEGDAPYEVSLNEELRRGDAFALWVHRYSKAALLHRLPGLEGLSAAEVVAALKPRFDPLPQSHALVPVTPEVLYAEVQADTVGPVVYQVRPYSSWQREISDHPERAFTLDVPEALVCRGVSHEQLQLPAGVAASAIAAISGEEAIFTGTSSDGPAIGRLSGNTVRLLRTPRPSLGWSTQLVYDQAAKRVIGTDRGGHGLRFDLEGGTLPFPTGRVLEEISVGRDGSLQALDRGLLVREEEGRWVGPEGPSGFARLRVYNKMRRMAWLNDWVRVAMGESWEPNGVVAFARPRELAVDGTMYYALLDDGAVADGLETGAGSWLRVDQVDVMRARSLAALESRRFAVGGIDGYLLVRIGERFCTYEVGPETLFKASAVPETGVAYFLMETSPGQASKILRVNVGASD